MQIKYLGADKFEIKTRDAKLDLGNRIAINGFLFPGAGEYEKNGIFIEGIAINGNTIYVVRAEEINICYLGKISHELTEADAKEIGDIDILIIPLGEEGTINSKQAHNIISEIDPRIVIPMLFSDLAEFTKSEGGAIENCDLLKIKKAELPQEERRIINLSKE